VMRSSLSRRAPLAISLVALTCSFTGVGEAARKVVASKLKPGAVVRLDAHGKVPRRALPARARDAARLGGKPASAYLSTCPEDTVELGTWCLMSSTYEVQRADVGKNDYAYATQACVARGGYLPSAAQLIGAAPLVRISGTIDDNPLTAAVDEVDSDGLKDQREMSATLVTVTSGSSAAGSLGVTQGSKGDPNQGEPDPVPVPSDPMPSTLQYVTVFDHGDAGGFAGSKPVSQPERFRCAFDKTARSRGVEIATTKETR
jgi:hypothetical protein